MVVKLHNKYIDALNADIKRLLGEVDKLQVALKKNPKDAAAAKKLNEIKGFLSEESLAKRYKIASEQDAKSLGTMFKKEFNW